MITIETVVYMCTSTSTLDLLQAALSLYIVLQLLIGWYYGSESMNVHYLEPNMDVQFLVGSSFWTQLNPWA